MKKFYCFIALAIFLSGCSTQDSPKNSDSSTQSLSSSVIDQSSVTQEQTKSMNAYLIHNYISPEGSMVFRVFDPEALECKEIVMDGTTDKDIEDLYFNGNDYVTIEIQQEGDILKCMNNAFKVIEPPDTASATIQPDGTWNYEPLIGHMIANDTEIGKKLSDLYSRYDFIVSSDEEYKYLPPDKINEELCMMYTKYSIEDKAPYTEALWPSLTQVTVGEQVCYVFDADIFLDTVHHFFPATADIDFKNHFLDTENKSLDSYGENQFYYNPDENQFVFDIGGRGGVRFSTFLIEFENLPDNTIRFVFMDIASNYWDYTVKLLDNDGYQFIKIDVSTK